MGAGIAEDVGGHIAAYYVAVIAERAVEALATCAMVGNRDLGWVRQAASLLVR